MDDVRRLRSLGGRASRTFGRFAEGDGRQTSARAGGSMGRGVGGVAGPWKGGYLHHGQFGPRCLRVAEQKKGDTPVHRLHTVHGISDGVAGCPARGIHAGADTVTTRCRHGVDTPRETLFAVSTHRDRDRDGDGDQNEIETRLRGRAREGALEVACGQISAFGRNKAGLPRAGPTTGRADQDRGGPAIRRRLRW